MRLFTILIILNIISFLILANAQFFGINEKFITENILFSQKNFVSGAYWTVITSLFVHADIMHLLLNMLGLYAFGKTAEKIYGSLKFILVYFVGGILSFLVGSFFYPSEAFLVGASGAIFSLLSLVMLSKPISFSIVFFPLPLGLISFLYIVSNILSVIYRDKSNIGFFAHIIGFLIGFIFGIKWCPEWKKNFLVTLITFVIFLIIVVFIL
ncbi:MAG: rhomboid family intramembrane serine protease [Candidatus Parvarchaeota archaeon]|nr:rhomboid family intramembrane serine protease [Candidatus Jingweiarchaeum tengchongense]MCW1298037.1 rhomboid family intramembrane serine protease [Candidatus Jingweiarchaeum tengchongense]MCW1300163.1 rhomboid family intramembrane serine protease [Candidatus Jingweiarchaeum tengchongense]MCW1304373.1 rhomboid family intramembrane serine protease [Candidatus Jingweiarchaeum tengchongense]MCW1305907.1 rhomboid family intramembrane serine protease [Candidatus Jingweiarchaeum tengchongense]